MVRRESFLTDEIVVPERLRALNESGVAVLIESIRDIGLRTPITVRQEGADDDLSIVLVAGRHRLEACRRLGWQLIDCTVFDGNEIDTRLWEIAENLHRAELTVTERSEHIAEWLRLTEEKSAQVAPKSKTETNPRGAGRTEGGINAAVRELGIDRSEAQRAVKIASLSDEAKAAAREVGRDNNQSVLLRASREAPERQVAVIREYVPPPRAPASLNDLDTEEAWLAAIMRVWNRGAKQWRERFLETVDAPVFDRTNVA